MYPQIHSARRWKDNNAPNLDLRKWLSWLLTSYGLGRDDMSFSISAIGRSRIRLILAVTRKVISVFGCLYRDRLTSLHVFYTKWFFVFKNSVRGVMDFLIGHVASRNAIECWVGLQRHFRSLLFRPIENSRQIEKSDVSELRSVLGTLLVLMSSVFG